MKKEEILKLAKQCMFTFSEDEISYVAQNFEVLQQQIAVLDEINTEDCEEMIFPFEQPQSFLREDVVEKVLTREEVLQNAVSKTTEFVKVATKVVK